MVQNSVIIVTGASHGLGRELALHLSAQDAYVVLVSRNESQLEEISSAADTETLVAPTDVTDPQAVDDTVSKTIERFGQIDGLVNNAGIGLMSIYNEGKPLIEISYTDWKKILDVNLTGVFLFSKEVLKHMVKEKQGNIINISSKAGKKGVPNWIPYVTTKWGIEGFTKSIALESKSDGVNVNSLYPGGRCKTGFWEHLPPDEHDALLPAHVLNKPATLLLNQPPDGVTGKSKSASGWISYFD
jgi:3-oxoacyl-[acyl-carrier protein] reductase